MRKITVSLFSLAAAMLLFSLRSYAGSEKILGCDEGVVSVALTEGQTTQCDRLAKILEIVPIIGADPRHWYFKGEKDTRQRIEQILGTSLQADIIPMGYIERHAPDGRSLLVIFDVNYADYGLNKEPKPRDPQESRGGFLGMAAADERNYARLGRSSDFLNAFAEFNLYSKVVVYIQKHGEPYQFSGAHVLTGIYLGDNALKSAKEFAAGCLPCHGWLCGDRPIACFSRFDASDFEQIHVEDKGEDFSGFHSFEVLNRKLQEMNTGRIPGTWRKKAEGWLFIGDNSGEASEECPKSIYAWGYQGNVFARNNDSGKYEISQKLTDKYNPYTTRTMPEGCDIKFDEPKGRFF